MITKLIKDDEFGILSDNDKIPYVGFLISPRDFELIQHMKVKWFETNGQKLFKVKDKEGKDTGEYIAYVVFVREEFK